jgi:predicted Zn-dependent protease with MMP-like domain
MKGVPVGDKHSAPSGTMPDRIRLFRARSSMNGSRGGRDAGASGGACVIHEVGHHFGLSDADIEALEDMA